MHSRRLKQYFVTVQKVGSREAHTVELYARNAEDAKKNVIYASPDYKVVRVRRE